MDHGRCDVANDGCLGIASQRRLQDAGQLTVPIWDVTTYEDTHDKIEGKHCQRSTVHLVNNEVSWENW